MTVGMQVEIVIVLKETGEEEVTGPAGLEVETGGAGAYVVGAAGAEVFE